MWPLSSAAAHALTQHHSTLIRATAFAASFGTVSDLPVSSGTVTVDAGSQTRRRATIGFAASQHYWPDSPFAILSPLGSELLIEYGIVLDSGIEWVPLIRGPITEAHRAQPFERGSAAIEVTMADRSLRVAESKFDAPVQTVAGATKVAEIERLITEVLPLVTVTDETGSADVAAQIEIERERWAEGVEKLATSLAAEVFADPVGNFTIRPQPTLDDTPVWVLSNAVFSIVTSVDDQASRESAYSKVVASGQRVNGDPPVWAAATDNDPSSPTYVGGPFGTRTKFLTSNLLTTTDQCLAAATAVLQRSRGMSDGVTVSAVPNPALEAGDVVVLRADPDAGETVHIIDSVTIPLSAKDPQRIVTRSVSPTPEFS